MKRKDLIMHLLKNNCIQSATIPRHRNINTFTARGICKDLGIKVIKIK